MCDIILRETKRKGQQVTEDYNRQKNVTKNVYHLPKENLMRSWEFFSYPVYIVLIKNMYQKCVN